MSKLLHTIKLIIQGCIVLWFCKDFVFTLLDTVYDKGCDTDD